MLFLSFFFAYAFRTAFCSIFVCKWATNQTLVASESVVTQMDFSLEVLNYFRVCYIAVNIIPDGLRAVFKQEWDSLYNATAFGGWKDTPQNGFDFYNTEPLRSRIKNARLLMTILGGNTEKWDCSCLFFAILFSDTIGKTLSPVVRREVDNLRQIQDDIAHINEFALTDAEFYHYVARVLAAFSFLQLPINAVDDIKKQTVFPSSELAALSIKTHDLRVDVQRKEQETKNLTLELQSMKKEVETSTQEINSKIESFCILTSKPSHPIIRRVNDVTRVVKKLDELQNRSKGAISTVYLSGIPGCGKSQIARQVGEEIFFKRWLEDRTFVATLNAETLVSLAESYCSLARHFGITEYALATLEASRNLHEKIAYLKTSIFSKTKQFSNWLIIVDNVVDLSLVRDDLPPSGRKEFGHGQVLITIQDPRSIPSFASLTYHESVSKGMRPDEAVDLLRLVSEIQNQEEAEKVAEVLEYQPLALANAAFYVQTVVVSGSPNYSWANYLETLRRRRLRESQMPLVPSEIKARGRKAMLVYENALKTGKVKVYRARIMFIGQDRAGKTSLKNSFLGLPFDREQQSTDGIEMDPSKFEVIVDQVCNWKRTVDVSQFAHSLARVVAGKLEQEQTEVDPAQVSVFNSKTH